TGKQVFQSSGTVSQFGSVHGDFTLASDAALGYYSVSVTGKGIRAYAMSGGFQVEEYKKPEYEVRVTPDKPRILEGETITATIEARYSFGEPVPGATVKYVVHRSTYWSPFIEYEGEEGDGGDYDGEGDMGGGRDYDYGGEQLSEQTGKLDANG